MKNFITCLAIFLFAIINVAFAQTIEPSKLYSGIKQSFNILYTTGHLHSSKPHIIISNIKNRFADGRDRLKDKWTLGMDTKDIHVDTNQVYSIAKRVLVNKLGTLKNMKEIIDVTFVFNSSDGSIVDTDYTLNQPSLITFAEIEEIDDQLRKNVKATFTGLSYTHYYGVIYWLWPKIKF